MLAYCQAHSCFDSFFCLGHASFIPHLFQVLAQIVAVGGLGQEEEKWMENLRQSRQLWTRAHELSHLLEIPSSLKYPGKEMVRVW